MEISKIAYVFFVFQGIFFLSKLTVIHVLESGFIFILIHIECNYCFT